MLKMHLLRLDSIAVSMFVVILVDLTNTDKSETSRLGWLRCLLRQQLDNLTWRAVNRVTVINLRFLKETKTHLCVRHKYKTGNFSVHLLTYFKSKYTRVYAAFGCRAQDTT